MDRPQKKLISSPPCPVGLDAGPQKDGERRAMQIGDKWLHKMESDKVNREVWDSFGAKKKMQNRLFLL